MELVLASGLGLGSLASVAIYRFIRPHFPVSVNCHFCNKNFKVRDRKSRPAVVNSRDCR